MSVAPGRERAGFAGEGRFPHRTEDQGHQVGERGAFLARHGRKTAVVYVGVVEARGGDACVGTFGWCESVPCVADPTPNCLVAEGVLWVCGAVHVRLLRGFR